jgi:hypothetical protein
MKAKVLIAFILGLSISLFTGTAIEGSRREALREFGEIGVYSSSFSGITPDGFCYLAITNTKTGNSEIFGIPKEALDRITEKPFQLTDQTSVIVELSHPLFRR